LQIIQTILLLAPVLLFSVIAHEIAHGWAALKQGDRTALDAGRLTWNPRPHIDPFFTILLPIMMIAGSTLAGGQPMVFGGARPVPVDPRNYRQPRWGDIIVSLAGVATNAIIALACVALYALAGVLGKTAPALAGGLGIVQALCDTGVKLNTLLIAFNLLPIPPLDGSHVFKYLLPRPLAVQYERFGRFGLLALIALLAWGERFLYAWLSPFYSVAGRVFSLVRTWELPTTSQWVL
jgi:Zn-dependent protease